MHWWGMRMASDTVAAWELPEAWETTRLGSVVKIKSGFACAKRNLVSAEKGIAHLRPFNVDTKGQIDLSEVYYIPRDYKDNVEKYALEPGHVLFNNTNSVELVGKTALVRETLECAFSNHIYRLTLKPQAQAQLDPAWLALALRRLWAGGYFEQRCNRWIGQAGFNSKMLRAVDIPLPSVDEQRRIVARSEELFARIEEAQCVRTAAYEYSDRLIDAALHEAFEVLGPERVPLRTILREKLRNGWSPRCQDSPPGTPVLRLGAVLGFEFNRSEVKYTQLQVKEDARYWLKSGDVLVSRSNTPALVGHAAIYRGTPSPCIYPDLLIRVRVDKDIADPQFVVYWLRGREIRNFVASRARGASSTMKKISQKDLREMPFPKVAPSEQRRLVAGLNEVKTQVTALQRAQRTASAELIRLEQSILARAFQGEL